MYQHRRILSYEGRGVPPGFRKDDHSIVHSGKQPPEAEEWEKPTREDRTTLRLPIRIKRFDRASKLMPLTRLRYSTIYLVKYDVKACAFGRVDERCRWTLRQQVKAHLRNFEVSTRTLRSGSDPTREAAKLRQETLEELGSVNSSANSKEQQPLITELGRACADDISANVRISTFYGSVIAHISSSRIINISTLGRTCN